MKSLVMGKGRRFLLGAVFSFLFVFPYFFLAFYNVSGAADDMFFASFYPELSYWDKMYTSYTTYIGRYFNAFFFCLPDKVFMEIWFAQLHPIIDLLLLYSGINFLIRQSGLIKRNKSFFLTLLILMIFLTFAPKITTLYWFSGATVYLYPFSGLMFLFGFLIKDFRQGLKIWEKVLVFLLIFAICGSNEIYMVQVVFIVLLQVCAKLYYNRPGKWFAISLVLMAILCNYFVITSPGTLRRISGESYRLSESHTGSVIASFLPVSFTLFWKWIFDSGLFILPLLLVFGGDFAKSFEKAKWKGLGVFIFFTGLCFIVGGVIIFIYSFGARSPLLPRVENVLFLYFIIAFFYFSIWLKNVISIKFNVASNSLLFFVGICFLVFAKSNNILEVYSDLLEGTAKRMQQESVWRYDYIESAKDADVVIPKLTVLPKTLHVPEWGTNPNAFGNVYLAKNFSKKSIVVDYTTTVEDFMEDAGEFGDINSTEGFKIYFQDDGEKLIIKNDSGDLSKNFFVHIYPIEKESLPKSRRVFGFQNLDFDWTDMRKKIVLDLPDYPIRIISIGQFDNVGRIWDKRLDPKSVRSKDE